MQEKEYMIAGKKWIIKYDPFSHKILDVCVSLSKKEYLDLKTKLPEPEINHKNSSAVAILKNAFVKARYEKALEKPERANTDILDEIERKTLHVLEKLSLSINGAYSDPLKKIQAINGMIREHNTQINALKTSLYELLARDSSLSDDQKNLIIQDVEELSSHLKKGIARLLEQLNQLEHKKPQPTHDQVDLLLSAQDRGNVYSIGQFIGEQTQHISRTAKDISSLLENRYLLDIYYQKNNVTASFIEAESELHIRHQSHYGARYVNTQTQDSEPALLPEEGEFSVLPFMRDTTAAEIDKIICLVSQTPLSQRSLAHPSKTWGELVSYAVNRSFLIVGLFTIAPITEIILSGVHLALALPATIVSSIFSLSSNHPINKYIDNLNAIHRFISPTRALRNRWNAQYKRLNEDLNPIEVNHPHQKMIDDFNTFENESVLVNGVQAITQPENIVFASKLGLHLAYQTVGTFAYSLGVLLISPINLFKKAPSDAEIFKTYDQNYHVLKPIMQSIIRQANEEQPAKESMSNFPGLRQHQIDYGAESPAKVINEIMYLLNDKVIHHLSENHPGPATFFFMISLLTFGANLAPIGALSWMHGAPGYFKLIQASISQAFTGYSGPMSGISGATHGSVAALLQFKLFTLGASGLLSAADKNNDVFEKMAQHPEEMIAGFVAFVGVGYAMAYLPYLPSVPNHFSFLGQKITLHVDGINPLDGYSMMINPILNEAREAQKGALSGLEYGFLGYKTLLWIMSMTENGKSESTLNATAHLIEQFRKEDILSIKDPDEIRAKIKSIVSQTQNNPFNQEKRIDQLTTHLINFIQKDKLLLKEKIASTTQAIQQEQERWDQMLKVPLYDDHLNSYEKLDRAIKMLSDKDIPCAFTDKNKAIQYYNALSQVFDAYHHDVQQGKYPGHQVIPKEDFLQAFRNKHISSGSYNFLRLLSFYPGYPFRYVWREMQLKLNPSPYTIDKINASRKKDAVLRNDWIAIVKMSIYNLANLCNKFIKACVGLVPSIIIIGYGTIGNIIKGLRGQEIDFRPMSTSLQRLGRFLDKYIAIQNLVPWSEQRLRFAKNVHESSRYDDLIAAGQKTGGRLAKNKKDEMILIKKNAKISAATEVRTSSLKQRALGSIVTKENNHPSEEPTTSQNTTMKGF